MCTVTAVATRQTVRLACNRDELRCRPVALPPQIEQFGKRRAALPIDPTSGGTWVGVNDAGLALALLNVNSKNGAMAPRTATLSRGKIIPALLHDDTPLTAAFSALALDPARYAPFRLVLVNRREAVEVHSDGTRIRLVWRIGLTRPQFFTSSGLGDQAVEGPRRQLFGEFFDQPGDQIAQQDAFHRHRWPDRPHLSVCMDREDARTVSHTVVSLDPDKVTLSYHPDAPDRPAEAVAMMLPIYAGGVA
jgi:Transport and Golgi organisation 2